MQKEHSSIMQSGLKGELCSLLSQYSIPVFLQSWSQMQGWRFNHTAIQPKHLPGKSLRPSLWDKTQASSVRYHYKWFLCLMEGVLGEKVEGCCFRLEAHGARCFSETQKPQIFFKLAVFFVLFSWPFNTTHKSHRVWKKRKVCLQASSEVSVNLIKLRAAKVTWPFEEK